MRQEEKASRKGRSGRRGKEGLAAVHHPDRRGAAFRVRLLGARFSLQGVIRSNRFVSRGSLKRGADPGTRDLDWRDRFSGRRGSSTVNLVARTLWSGTPRNPARRMQRRCWKTRQPYHPQRYLTALAQHGSPLASTVKNSP
jgi:hypothetical protein